MNEKRIPKKAFNKFFCPGCDKYLGRKTRGKFDFEKPDKCPKCNLPFDWESGFQTTENVCEKITEAEARQILMERAMKGGFTHREYQALRVLWEELIELNNYRDLGTVEELSQIKKEV